MLASKPQRGAVDLSRIDQRYNWYWNKAPVDSHGTTPTLGAWFWPFWEWGATNVVRSITNVRDPLGVILSGATFEVEGRDFGLDANTSEGINFGNFYPFFDSATPWTVWAAFRTTDTETDDNCLWSKFGAGSTKALLWRVDKGPSPENLECKFNNALVTGSDPADHVIHENVPYLIVGKLVGTTWTQWAIDLNTGKFVIDGDGGPINTGTSTFNVKVWIGSRDTDADHFQGAIFAAGLIHNLDITREQVALLGRDYYGPIRPLRRKVWKVPAAPAGDPEGPLIGGKLIGGGILSGRLVG